MESVLEHSVLCPHCGKDITIKFTTRSLGLLQEWTCPYDACKKRFGAILAVDPTMAMEVSIIVDVNRLPISHLFAKELSEGIARALACNIGLQTIIERARENGFEPEISTDVDVAFTTVGPPCVPMPLVKGDEVSLGVFTAADETALHDMFRISLKKR